MNPETIESIKSVLSPVAEKIGQGAEYGWEVLVAGQFAEGVGLLVIALTLISIVLLCYVVAGAVEKKTDADGAIYGMAFGINLILLIPILALLYEGILRVIAPEYMAIKFLISLGS